MKKALFLLMALVLCFSACTVPPEGEGEKLRIGIIQYAPHPSLDDCRTGFIDGMTALGYGSDKVTYDIQNANGEGNSANTMAQKMVADNCDLIVTIATPATQAALTATVDTDIPVIFIAVSDPVGSDIIDSMAKPGRNVTGVSDALDVSAQIALVQELLPEAKKLGVVYNTGEANSVSQVKALEDAVKSKDLTLEKVTVNNTAEVNLAAESILTKVDCLVNVMDNTVVSAMAIIADKSLQNKVPVIGSTDDQVKEGAIASTSLDYKLAGEQAAAMAVKILVDGDFAGDIPAELVKTTEAAINPGIAEKLGIEIPSALLEKSRIVE